MTRNIDGLTSGVLAFSIWGLLPLYWKELQSIGALEVLCHRALWGLLFICIACLLTKKGQLLLSLITNKRLLLIISGGSIFICLNWFVHMYGIKSGKLMECSLGYYMNPLFNVILGTVFMGERLRLNQWIAIALAGTGVLSLLYLYGEPPWIAILITLTFGLYGACKKYSDVDPSVRLFIESLTLGLLLIPTMFFLEKNGDSNYLSYDFRTKALLFGSGLATLVPLLFFAIAAKKLKFSTLGFLQYISPSLQMMVGVLAFNEHLDFNFIIAFMLIWSSLLFYSFDGILKIPLEAFTKIRRSIQKPSRLRITCEEQY